MTTNPSYNFETLYIKVKPIVAKFQRSYHIALWDKNDWHQEGMIILHLLCQQCPEISLEEKKLFTYFKTKFSNHINDVLRKQESQKRRFNKMAYEEIGEIGHSLADKTGLPVAEYLAFKEQVETVKAGLSEDEKEQLDKLITGERFAGKKKLIRKLQPQFKDFQFH